MVFPPALQSMERVSNEPALTDAGGQLCMAKGLLLPSGQVALICSSDQCNFGGADRRSELLAGATDRPI
jgi:hypothetical protein